MLRYVVSIVLKMSLVVGGSKMLPCLLILSFWQC